MSETRPRKKEHLELCLNEDVRFQTRGTGLDSLCLVHDALPEIDFAKIDLSTNFLGHSLDLPLIISSMTGGTEEAGEINRVLARGASAAGCAMAVGSQRAAIEEADLIASYQVREEASDVPLFANLGAVQLNYGYGIDQCLEAVEMLEADGIFLHLNSLQEALQPEGNSNFEGLLDRIHQLCEDLPCPVLLKTTGNGLSTRTATKLISLPLAGLEVSGAGGTSWARIEAMRSGDTEALEIFSEWGEDTASSISAARSLLPNLPLIASGGLRNGAEIAKVLALGATLGGMARPLLEAAAQGEKVLLKRLDTIAWQLRLSLFYCGRTRIGELSQEDLRQKPSC